jgi:GNAT superfamily N-acetyltransferase
MKPETPRASARSRLPAHLHPLVRIRPAAPEDAAAQRAYFRGLSRQSLYLRFMTPCRQPPAFIEAELARPADGSRIVLLAESLDPLPCVVGEARLAVLAAPEGACEVAISVADAWRRRGVGSALVQSVQSAAAALGMRHMFADTLAINVAALSLARKFDSAVAPSAESGAAFRIVANVAPAPGALQDSADATTPLPPAPNIVASHPPIEGRRQVVGALKYAFA